ncbi:MAG: hypothetical protein ACQEP7_07575 [bacterium]
MDEDFREDKINNESIVWLKMDPIQFLEEKRVRDVGLVYAAPPAGSGHSRTILKKLPGSSFTASNCLLLLEEPVWEKTQFQNYPQFNVIETYDFSKIRIAVTQLLDTPETEK